MKKLLTAFLTSALLVTVCGCRNINSEKTTALSLMEAVNDKNVFHTDPNARLWYEINTEYFDDSDSDGKGDLQGIIRWLPYFSDYDPASVKSDLNMTGVYLTDIISADSSGSVIDYYKLNPGVGTEEDLSDLCQKGVKLDIPVMISLDLSSCSTKNPQFEEVVAQANALGKDASLSELDSTEASMFSITDEQPNSNWIQLGESPFYYLGYNGTNSPNYNQDSEVYRQMVRGVIEYYLSLGVQGFYIENMNSFYSNSNEKNAEFSNWLVSTVSDMSSYAAVVFNTASFEPEFTDVDGWIAQSSNAGVEGALAKAATGTISASELGDMLEGSQDKIKYPASYINTPENTLDLLKTQKKASTFKMLMALQILSSGQVFITAGDEIGLPSNEFDLVSEALDPASKTSEEKTSDKDKKAKDEDETAEVSDSLTFGSFEEQKKDGNSVLNFVLQAILLRDAYMALSSGKTEVLRDYTDDSVLVIRKSVENSEVIAVFNLSTDEQKLNVGSLKLAGLPVEIGGILLTGEEDISLENGNLLMPAQSVCILK